MAFRFLTNRGKSIVASLAGAIIPASTAATTAMSVGSLLKAVPGVGTAVGALSMPVFSAGVTYVIGKVFIQHFASGGTLLDFNPPDYREFIKAQQEKLSGKSASSTAGKPSPASRSTSARGRQRQAPDRAWTLSLPIRSGLPKLPSGRGRQVRARTSVSRETLRYGLTAHPTISISRVRCSRWTLRQPAPNGVHGHISSVSGRHSGGGTDRVAYNRAITPC